MVSALHIDLTLIQFRHGCCIFSLHYIRVALLGSIDVHYSAGHQDSASLLFSNHSLRADLYKNLLNS